MSSLSFIPCENSISSVNDLVWKSWKDRLLAERLTRKALIIEEHLRQNNYHWEEVCWWMLARNFGVTVNMDLFEAVARSIPLTILSKHKHQLIQIEALLFGQAGLLKSGFSEDYPRLLQKEFKYLKQMYKLPLIHQPVHFLRMRPGNFPTIRLAQLAALITNSSGLFSKIRDTTEIQNLRQWFDVTANDYWHYHYRFDETSSYKKKNLGESMIDNIIINTISPFLFAFGDYQQDEKFKSKAIQWLEQTDPELNGITNKFMDLGITNTNAFDSQSLIELKKYYCLEKRCLECAIGNNLLNGSF